MEPHKQKHDIGAGKMGGLPGALRAHPFSGAKMCHLVKEP